MIFTIKMFCAKPPSICIILLRLWEVFLNFIPLIPKQRKRGLSEQEVLGRILRAREKGMKSMGGWLAYNLFVVIHASISLSLRLSNFVSFSMCFPVSFPLTFVTSVAFSLSLSRCVPRKLSSSRSEKPGARYTLGGGDSNGFTRVYINVIDDSKASGFVCSWSSTYGEYMWACVKWLIFEGDTRR